MTSLLVPIALTTDSRATVADHRRRSSSGVWGALRGDVRQSWRPLEVGRNGGWAGLLSPLHSDAATHRGCGGCHFRDDPTAAIAGERRHVGLAPTTDLKDAHGCLARIMGKSLVERGEPSLQHV